MCSRVFGGAPACGISHPILGTRNLNLPRQEREFLKKASRKSTPRKRLPSKAKPSRSTKLDVLGRKDTWGLTSFLVCAGGALENCQPEVLDSSRPAEEKAWLWAEWRHVGTMVKLVGNPAQPIVLRKTTVLQTRSWRAGQELIRTGEPIFSAPLFP